MQAQVREICAFLTALLVADNLRAGQELVDEHNFKDYLPLFQTIIEVGRRHKVVALLTMRGAGVDARVRARTHARTHARAHTHTHTHRCVVYELCNLSSPFWDKNLNLYLLGQKIVSGRYLCQ